MTRAKLWLWDALAVALTLVILRCFHLDNTARGYFVGGVASYFMGWRSARFATAARAAKLVGTWITEKL